MAKAKLLQKKRARLKAGAQLVEVERKEGNGHGFVLENANDITAWFTEWGLKNTPFRSKLRGKRVLALDDMRVWDEYRGKGVGREILQDLIAKGTASHVDAIVFFVDVKEKQRKGLRLLDWYQRLGFKVVGEHDGMPIMMKWLSQKPVRTSQREVQLSKQVTSSSASALDSITSDMVDGFLSAHRRSGHSPVNGELPDSSYALTWMMVEPKAKLLQKRITAAQRGFFFEEGFDPSVRAKALLHEGPPVGMGSKETCDEWLKVLRDQGVSAYIVKGYHYTAGMSNMQQPPYKSWLLVNDKIFDPTAGNGPVEAHDYDQITGKPYDPSGRNAVAEILSDQPDIDHSEFPAFEYFLARHGGYASVVQKLYSHGEYDDPSEDELRQRYAAVVRQLSALSFPLTIYRGLTLPDGIEQLVPSDVGWSWTWRKAKAISYHGGGENDRYRVILRTRVNGDAVNWDSTVIAHLDQQFGANESEIVVKRGAELTIDYLQRSRMSTPTWKRYSKAVSVRASAESTAHQPYEKGAAFPKAGATVDGLTVGDRVANTGSIDASLNEYEILPGIREVPLDYFNSKPTDLYYSASDIDRCKRLASEIEASGRIDPLIVVIDQEGPYILEGGHRLGALHLLHKATLPALVVRDLDGLEEEMPKQAAEAAAPTDQILVVVHPGSACGSADFHLRGWAQGARDSLIREFERWNGGVIVLSGALDDELSRPSYRSLDNALNALLARAKAAGRVSVRANAPDPSQEAVIKRLLRKKQNQVAHYVVTGAWYDDNEEGCVGGVYDAIKSLGFSVEVSDSAVRGRTPDDDEEDDEEDDTPVEDVG